MSFFLRARRRMACGVLFALALSGPVVAAPPAIPISYPEALQQALANAPTLQVRRSQIDASTEEAARAGALPDPRLIVGLANWPVSGPDAFSLRADEMTTQQVGLMQEFPARAKRRAEQALAQATLAQARSLSMVEQQMVVQAAAQAWIELRSTQQAVDALEGLREPARIAERAARARLAGGTAGASDVLAAQAVLLQLDNRLEQVHAEHAAAQAGLARWLGIAPEAILASGTAPDFSQLPLEPTQLLANLDQHTPLLGWEARQSLAQPRWMRPWPKPARIGVWSSPTDVASAHSTAWRAATCSWWKWAWACRCSRRTAKHEASWHDGLSWRRCPQSAMRPGASKPSRCNARWRDGAG